MLAYDCRSDQARLWQGDDGGAKRDRTADLLRARQALSQLSYGPEAICVRQGASMRRIACYASIGATRYHANLVGLGRFEQTPRPHPSLYEPQGVRSNQLSERMVGLGRFELPTSPLSGVRSNQLSYRPGFQLLGPRPKQSFALVDQVIHCEHLSRVGDVVDKEVIQPQVPLRLPCYDFTPVMNHTVVIALRS